MKHLTSLNFWAHVLITAAITGGVDAFLDVYKTPSDIRFDHDSLHRMAIVAGGGALLGVAAVLKQSPLPPKQ